MPGQAGTASLKYRTLVHMLHALLLHFMLHHGALQHVHGVGHPQCKQHTAVVTCVLPSSLACLESAQARVHLHDGRALSPKLHLHSGPSGIMHQCSTHTEHHQVYLLTKLLHRLRTSTRCTGAGRLAFSACAATTPVRFSKAAMASLQDVGPAIPFHQARIRCSYLDST